MNIQGNVSNTCNSRIKYAIVSMCLTHGKGGYSDKYGLLNSRGGSKGTEGVYRHCTTPHTKQETCGYQGWRTVSYFGRGLPTVQGHSTNRQTRREQVNAGYFLPATPRMSPVMLPTRPSGIPRVTLPAWNYRTPQQERQGFVVA